MSTVVKGTLVGVLIVVLVAGAAVAAVYSGILPDPRAANSERAFLVVATAPDETGTDVAAVAFAVDPRTQSVTLLSTLETATIPGTSATTARDSLPFGGGDAVARALAPQTDGTVLDWIIVPSAEWSALVDDAGGISTDVPSGLNAYSEGRLVIIEAGRQRLDGEKAVVVASSTPYLGGVAEQARVLRELSAGVSTALGSSGTRLREAVESGAAESSLEPSDIPAFTAER